MVKKKGRMYSTYSLRRDNYRGMDMHTEGMNVRMYVSLYVERKEIQKA